MTTTMLIRPYYVGVCCSVAVTFAPDRERLLWECIALNCTQRDDSVVLNAERLTRLNNHHHQSTMASNTTAPKLKYVETSEVRELVAVIVVVVVAMSIMRALWNPNMMQLYIYIYMVCTYVRYPMMEHSFYMRLQTFFKMVNQQKHFLQPEDTLTTYISTIQCIISYMHCVYRYMPCHIYYTGRMFF